MLKLAGNIGGMSENFVILAGNVSKVSTIMAVVRRNKSASTYWLR
jgi:hypothetical protein